jgi:hypothetical protein
MHKRACRQLIRRGELAFDAGVLGVIRKADEHGWLPNLRRQLHRDVLKHGQSLIDGQHDFLFHSRLSVALNTTTVEAPVGLGKLPMGLAGAGGDPASLGAP